MSELFNPEIKFTQKQIATLLGLESDRQVRNLITKGVLPAAKGRNGMDPLKCIHAYVAYKTQTLSKAETDDDFCDSQPEIDYDTERALNVREQRRARRIQNELALKTLIPTDVCIHIYSSLVAAARSKVLAIEGKAATELPGLTIKDKQVLRGLLYEALADLADEPIPSCLKAYLDECEFDLDAAAEPDD
ncbi:hypothetical protein [Zooshikella sp. RANM57]|uniref:hypothetical protein n=1 Tax=Zooshikella sp. RANM57 TaxID=3425863 RepID=UPI003D6F46CF